MAKLFEFIVYSEVKCILNHIVIADQHDFRPGKSTVTSSVVFTSFISEIIEVGGQVDVVYTDFKKAFYTINYYFLIKTFKSLGIGNPLISSLKSYLFNRKQFVRIFNSVSSLFEVPSGAPQGVILVLFFLFHLSIQFVNG